MLFDLDGRKDIVESDAQERHVYELPTQREVAAELRANNSDAFEMASPTAELDANSHIKYIRLGKTETGARKAGAGLKWTWISFGKG